MEDRQYSCIVVGAGLSGLYAAQQLKRFVPDVLVVEAHSDIGGRVRQVSMVPVNPPRGVGCGRRRAAPGAAATAAAQRRSAATRAGPGRRPTARLPAPRGPPIPSCTAWRRGPSRRAPSSSMARSPTNSTPWSRCAPPGAAGGARREAGTGRGVGGGGTPGTALKRSGPGAPSAVTTGGAASAGVRRGLAVVGEAAGGGGAARPD
jgi:hypothetical protein